jgi:hypothetical protein
MSGRCSDTIVGVVVGVEVVGPPIQGAVMDKSSEPKLWNFMMEQVQFVHGVFEDVLVVVVSVASWLL